MALLSMSQLKAENGIVRTRSLFYEFSYDQPDHVVLTLKENDSETTDGRPLLSLQKLFVDLTLHDPSEYEFSQVVFGSFEVWQKISAVKDLQVHIEKWRFEADTKRKMMAFKTIAAEAQEGRNAFAAAKYLIDEPWKTKGQAPADKRKTRQGIRETAEKAFHDSALEEDIKRLKEEGLIQ